MNFSDLGFGYPDRRARLFRTRERRRYGAETSPLSYGVAFTSFNPSIVRIPVALAHGEHPDNWKSRLSFKVRVPNLDMYRRVATVTGDEVVTNAALPPQNWVRIDEGPPVFMPVANLPNLIPNLPHGNRPLISQATRLIRTLRVLAGDREAVLFEQQRFDLVCELERWKNEASPEFFQTSLNTLPSTGQPLAIPTVADPAPDGADGVDMCATPHDSDALYSLTGLDVSFQIPLSFFGDKGFWPGVEKFVVEIEFNSPIEAFEVDSFIRSPRYFECAPIATEGPPTLAAHYHISNATQLPIPYSRFGYEIYGLTFDTDVVTFSDEAQRSVESALASNRLHTTYDCHSLFETNLRADHPELEIRAPVVLSNVKNWHTFFRRASRINDIYFNSYEMVNPAILTAQWRHGNERLLPYPLQLEQLYTSALQTRASWKNGKRMTKLAFLGDCGARLNVDDLYIISSEMDARHARAHISFQSPRCFMVATNFERDRDDNEREEKVSGRSTGEDVCLSLKITRDPPIVDEIYYRRSLTYCFARWSANPRVVRSSTVTNPRFNKPENWIYVPRFPKGYNTPSYRMLASLRTRLAWTVRVPFTKEADVTAVVGGLDVRLYDGRDFRTADPFTGTTNSTLDDIAYAFPNSEDFYIATTVLDHTRVVTWGQFGHVSIAE